MFRRMHLPSFKKEKHYTPITNEVSLNIAIVQAATMLDEAGVRAVSNGNVQEMLAVASGWMEFGVNMLGNPDGEDEEGEGEEEEILSETSVLGFRNPESREVMENEKQEDKRKAGL